MKKKKAKLLKKTKVGIYYLYIGLWLYQTFG